MSVEPPLPGPADYSLTKANLRKTPMFSNRQKTKPSYPESLNYTAKGRFSNAEYILFIGYWY